MERGLREVMTPPPMSDQRSKRVSISLEEATADPLEVRRAFIKSRMVQFKNLRGVSCTGWSSSSQPYWS